MACACSAMASVETATVDRIESVGEIDGVKNLGYKIHRAPTVDDAGVRRSATWKMAASAGVAIINTLMAIKIAKMQWQIASRYRDMFMEDHNRYLSKYYPYERKYMLEVGMMPQYTPDYKGRADLYGELASSSVSTADLWGDVMATQIPLCVDPSLGRMRDIDASLVETAATDAAHKQEDYDKILKDDLRFKWRSDALDRGRTLAVSSADMGNKAATLYNSLGDSIGKAAEGAMGALGYFGARHFTSLPTGTTSYDAVDETRTEAALIGGNLESIGGLTNPRLNNRTN